MNKFAALLALALITGCSSGPKGAEPDASAPLLVGFESPEAIMTAAEALLVDLELDEVSRLKVLKGLKELLADKALTLPLEGEQINAVGAFHSAGGGIILKISKGGGLVAFANGSERRRFESKSFAVGAIVGGAAAHGVFVVVALRGSGGNLAGQYSLTLHGGAIAQTSAGAFKATPKTGDHVIYGTSTSIGVSGEAGFGAGSLIFAPDNN